MKTCSVVSGRDCVVMHLLYMRLASRLEPTLPWLLLSSPEPSGSVWPVEEMRHDI